MGLLALLVLLILFLNKKEDGKKLSLTPVWIALGGTLIAFGLMIVSPGNLVRMDAMAKRPDLLKGAFLSVRYALGFIYHTLQAAWLPLLLIAVFMLSLSLQRDWSEINPRKVKWLFWAIPVGLFVAIIACCAPSAFAQGAYPEDRALIAAQWILVIGLGSWVYLLGITWMHARQSKSGFQIKPYFSNGLFILVMLSFYFMFMVMVTLSAVPALQQRAASWDARLESINQQINNGIADVVVAPMESVERIKELDDDPAHWVNKCAAVFYDVTTIRAE